MQGGVVVFLLMTLIQGMAALPRTAHQVQTYIAGVDVPPPRLIHWVEPMFPVDFLDRDNDQTVGLRILINERGEVSSAKILSGQAESLYEAAIRAVRQWRYEPTIAYGEPVRVIASVSAQFLSPRNKCGTSPPRLEPIHVGQNVQTMKLRHKVEPVSGQHWGRVILSVTVNEEGEVYHVRLLRGPVALEDSARSVVCRWRYEPTYIDFEVVPVRSIVTLEFK